MVGLRSRAMRPSCAKWVERIRTSTHSCREAYNAIDMPRTRSLAWSELKIGIVAVAAIGLAILLIVAVGGQGGFAWQRYELKTRFPNVQGLKSGAIVRLAGVDVGKVTSIDFAGSEV